MSAHDTYTGPLASRNASPEMLRLWSPRHKFNTWRRIWLAIAQAQHEVTKDWGDEPSSERGRSASEASSAKAGLAGASASAKSGPLVTKEQVDELRAVVERGITDEEIARASEIERDVRHDVMSHVHCLGERCPKSRPIIHLGCTSQDIVCNADLLIIRESLALVATKLQRTIIAFGVQAERHRALPATGFTHYQPAQPTTVGRRAAGWGYETLLTAHRLEWGTGARDVKLRGLRGATGTQASFLELLGGDAFEVDRLDAMFLCAMGRDEWYDLLNPERSPSRSPERLSRYRAAVEQLENGPPALAGLKQHFQERLAKLDAWRSSEQREALQLIREETYTLVTQTYPRVVDTFILSDLASIAAVLHKIATDIRLLSNRKELDEPFEEHQIGSSAMPYKRNPMLCERVCGLSRFVMNLVGNAYDTAATQWLERTLDDSSNRRLSLPEAFLALDGALDIMHRVASGLIVNEAMVRRNLMAELPFLATENILMEAVKAGGDRQDLHEKIRVHAQAAGHRVKQQGLDNDLIERLRSDPAFKSVHHLLAEDQLLDPMKYIGRSVEQTERFLRNVVEPLRERYGEELGKLGTSDRGV